MENRNFKLTPMHIYRFIMNLILIYFTVSHFGVNTLTQLVIIGACFKIVNAKSDEND